MLRKMILILLRNASVIWQFCSSILFVFSRCFICVKVPGTFSFYGDRPSLRAPLKMCSVRLLDCRKIAEDEPEDGASDDQYSSGEFEFIFSSEYIIVVLTI